jgi:hypothetical protein
MPKDLASGATLQVTSQNYVAQVADLPGKDSGLLATAVEAPGAGKPAVETGRQAARSPPARAASSPTPTNKAEGQTGCR